MELILPLRLMWERADKTRDGGVMDFEEFLYVGEVILKTYVAGMVAGVADDPDRKRYGLAYRLVRANGLGEWDDALAELSTGTATQHLRPGVLEAHRELTARHGAGSWMYEAVRLLQSVIRAFVPEAEAVPTKFDGRKWFSLFVYLRNKTRGHGAPTEAQKSLVARDLEASLRLVSEKARIFNLEWVFVKRNLSLKYNVLPLSVGSADFEELKGERARSHSYADGIYVGFGPPARVELMESNPDLIEFFYPNGHFRDRNKKMEWLSYVTGARRDLDGTPYLVPVSELPGSHTEGDRSLRLVGRCFANLPPPAKGVHISPGAGV